MQTNQTTNSVPGMRTLAGDLVASQKKQTGVTTTQNITQPEGIAADIDKIINNKQNNLNQIISQTATKEEPLLNIAPSSPQLTALKPLSSPKQASEPTIIATGDDYATATIIRDTKRNRFHLLPALKTSILTWLSDINDRYLTKKPLKYTVPETTHRKGVIQKATSRTGKIATFDTTSIQDRIRARRERTAPKTPLTIWTGNTEPGFALLEAPESAPPVTQITNVQIVPRKSVLVLEKPPIPITPVVVPTPVSIPTATLIEKSPIPTVVTMPPEVVTATPQDLPPTVSPPPTPKTTTPPLTKLKPSGLKEWLFLVNTNSISVGIILLLLSVFVISMAAYQWYSRVIPELVVTTSPSHSALVGERLQLLFSQTLETEQLLTLIGDNRRNSPYQIFELALTFDQAGQELLPPSSVFAGLNWSTNQLLLRSITTIRFGAISQDTPFVIMKISDPISARGHLLEWESTLLNDITPLFSLAGTTGESVTNVFSDVIIDSVDTRLLTSPTGDTLLIYALQDNLIIITTSESALRTLLAATKK